MAILKLGVPVSPELLAFADEEAARRGTTRSGLLAQLLEAEWTRKQTARYLDRHGWDVCEDTEVWRRYQRRRLREEYRADAW